MLLVVDLVGVREVVVVVVVVVNPTGRVGESGRDWVREPASSPEDSEARGSKGVAEELRPPQLDCGQKKQLD